MTAMLLAALLGACVGSFANLCALRWPRDESVLWPRSNCPGCGKPLSWLELTPVLGWSFLRGRCRRCSIPIPVQYPLMEVSGALIWVGMAASQGVGLEALRGALFLTILLAIAASDARFYIIPDQLSVGGAVLGLVLSLAPGGIDGHESAIGAAVGFASLWTVGWCSTLLLRRLAPERLGAFGAERALGGGDIKMMLMMGAFVGPGGVAISILVGSVAALAVFGPLSLRGQRLIPFGVFLGVGGAVAYTWGERLTDWYLGMFG